jgi:hypothetical protein
VDVKISAVEFKTVGEGFDVSIPGCPTDVSSDVISVNCLDGSIDDSFGDDFDDDAALEDWTVDASGNVLFVVLL